MVKQLVLTTRTDCVQRGIKQDAACLQNLTGPPLELALKAQQHSHGKYFGACRNTCKHVSCSLCSCIQWCYCTDWAVCCESIAVLQQFLAFLFSGVRLLLVGTCTKLNQCSAVIGKVEHLRKSSLQLRHQLGPWPYTYVAPNKKA